MKKTTLTALLNVVTNTTLVTETEKTVLTADIQAELDRLARKAEYVSPTEKAKKEENVALYGTIYDFIAKATAPVSVADITPALGLAYSPQRITSMVNRLVADGKLIRTYDKRKATYTINTDSE